MSEKMTNDRAVAGFMARAVMMVVFLGTGASLILFLLGQSSVAGSVCLGTGIIALIVLVIGGYFVARARA